MPRALLQDLAYPVLHVATIALPLLGCAAQRDHVMKVLVLARNRFKIIAVVDLRLQTRTIDQVDQLAIVPWMFFVKEPLDEAAHRRDTGAGRDHDTVA